jgi:hypothetical protein
MLKKISIFILLIVSQTSVAQNESLFNRLRAISSSGITFYNVDGINFSEQTIESEFNEKNLKKAYRKYKINTKDIKATDKELKFENYKVITRDEFEGGLVSINIYYFVKKKNDGISVFWFGYYNKSNPEFEKKMIDLILNDAIPQTCFSSLTTDTVNFAGRDIKLGGNCTWININNIQCPNYGQMNWSVHDTKESADLSIQNQLKGTKIKNGGKVVSEEDVAIIFENVPTKAKKVLYDFTGVTSLLASMSGGKNLTIYYISEKVSDNYVSCILSFWNNDYINPSGLPALLEEVMKLAEK